MKANIGQVDRWVRIILGLVLLSLIYFLRSDAGLWWWGLIGLVLLGTAAINFCPIWAALGISTRKKT
ncbi:MAG TPA: DUF2892 domain-containing protein [Devosiaceae bacterium]